MRLSDVRFPELVRGIDAQASVSHIDVIFQPTSYFRGILGAGSTTTDENDNIPNF